MNKGYSRQLQADYRQLQQPAELAAFSREDLADVSTRRRNIWVRNASRLAVLVLSACSFAIVLQGVKAGSRPDLSPADIVQMQGYGGRQSVPHTVTPESLGHSRSDSGNTGSIREVSARNLVIGDLQDIAPQIIDQHFPAPVETHSVIRMRVLQQWSNLRNRPDLSGDIIASLYKHDTVSVLGQTDQWLQVETDDYQQGYMHRSVLGEH